MTTAINDPSTQYVLPVDAPLLANLAALWAVDPALAMELEKLHADPSYPVEPSRKSGELTLALQRNGKSLFLHSRYAPVDEARKLVENLNTDERVAFYVHGFGLGYHIEALFERMSGEAILCILEPDLLLLRTALEQREFTKLIESRRVHFFWKLDKSDLFMRLMPHIALLSLGFDGVIHPPSLQLHPEFHGQMQQWIGEFASFSKTSINTLVINGRKTAENIARNIGWYVATPSVARLRDRYVGSPAIVVSAGPSLRKNKHLLREAARGAVIVAVQTTLQPLLEMGIEPQFVTSLDYHEICTRFFEKLPPTLATELIAEPKATDAIFKLNPGPLTLLGNSFAENLLHEMNLKKDALPSGATVAHLAYYLAEYIGCDPIIFVGQDLGFSDGLCYAPGTSYEDVWRPELSRFCTVEMKQWEQIARDRAILRKIPDQQGRAMYTEERLFTYLQQFERDFLRSRRTIIDATEGGAFKRGTKIMPLADAIAKHCQRPLPNHASDHPGLRWELIEPCIASIEARRREAEMIKQISVDTLPLLEEVREHIDDQPRVNRSIAKIDALRSRMDGLGACHDLITQLSQLTELRKFQDDRRIAASRVDGIDRQRRQVTRDIESVRGLAEAAKEFRKLMSEVIQHLSTMRPARREAA